MDIAAAAKKKLKGLFDLFIENPEYEGVKTQLVQAVEAHSQIAKIQKNLEEEGYE